MRFLCSLGLALLVALALASAAPTQPGGTDPDPPPLVTVEVLGGLCLYGGCYTRIDIHADATWHLAEGFGEPVSEASGTLGGERIERIATLIAAADFARLRAVPFSGTCPTAYDGPQFVYTFAVGEEPEVLDSCASDLQGVELTTELTDALEEIYRIYRQTR